MKAKGGLKTSTLTGKTRVLTYLSLSQNTVRTDETFGFTVRFSVVGGPREAFIQQMWEEAYDEGDKNFRVYYNLELRRPSLSVAARKPLYSLKFSRRASLYWSRNPDLPFRIWALITDELGDPHLPKDEKEAQSFIFDVEKSATLPASKLGKGKHDLVAESKIRWGRHYYAEKGSVKGSSNRAKIVCL